MKNEDFKYDFEKLIVYQKSLDFIHKIFGIFKQLPQDFKYSVGSNFIRAGMSIANNLAEGSGKKSIKEKGRYYSTSLDSTRECISVLNILIREKLISKEIYSVMRRESKEITNMLTGLLESLK